MVSMNGFLAWNRISFSVLVFTICYFSIKISLLILFIAYSFPSRIFITWNTLPNDPLSITFFILKSSNVAFSFTSLIDYSSSKYYGSFYSMVFLVSSFWNRRAKLKAWSYATCIRVDLPIFIVCSSLSIFS